MTIAVLGGTGFIGTAIIEHLTAQGHRPVAIARGRHPRQLPAEALFEPADRMNTEGLLAIFERHKIETVIDIFALGLLNTTPVLRAMQTHGGRYVPLSSVDVYSNYGGLLRREQPPIQMAPARETDPLRSFRYPYKGNPRRPQGVEAELFEDYDKILVEDQALANTAFSTTVIRAPMIFGTGDKQNRFAWAIDAIQSEQPIQVDERAAGWLNSYGYVHDVAHAIVLAALAPQASGRIFNVGQPFVRTPVEWLQRFAEAMGRPIRIDIVPPSAKGLLWERAEASDLRYPLTLDTTRIRTELGFTEVIPEADALRATIAAGG